MSDENARKVKEQEDKKKAENELKGLNVIKLKSLPSSTKEAEKKKGNNKIQFDQNQKPAEPYKTGSNVKATIVGQEKFKMGGKKNSSKETPGNERAKTSRPTSGNSIMTEDFSNDIFEFPAESEITVGDMAVFLRYVIATQKSRKDIDTFTSKVKQINIADKEEIIKDYIFLTNLEPGHAIDKNLEYYAGLNSYIAQIPIKPAKIDDFITEFDMLVNHWSLETLINQEDGRPFAYEVDHKFFDNIIEQALDSTLLPYDGITTSNGDPIETAQETKILGGYPGNTNLDNLITSLAAISGVSAKTVSKGRFPKLKAADWLDVEISPKLDESQQTYVYHISLLKEEDMELQLEYDLLLSSDHEYVVSRLKDSAKKVWEAAAATPNCHPLSTKITIIPQAHEYKPPAENSDSRHVKAFDFGMKIPDGRHVIDNSQILDSKKQAYGSIIQSNIDNKRLEQEILSADPSRTFDSSNFIVPTIASVFAEHEVLAFLELRHIKIREARIILLRQFNFFRSVERKLSIDLQRFRLGEGKFRKDMFQSVVEMWRKLEYFDLQNLKGQDSAKAAVETSNDDIRSIVNNRIQITDKKGVMLIYDIAIKDMELFEIESIKILTW